jgi:tetratricopeptide (TPR) repeat protein
MMDRVQLLEKFEQYWFGKSNRLRREIRFSRDEIFELLQHFKRNETDGNYILALETGLRFFPADLDLKTRYIAYLMNSNRWDTAEQELNKLLENQYFEPDVQYLYAMSLINKKAYGRAVRTLEQLPEEYKNKHPEVLKQLSIAYEKNKDIRNALTHYISYLTALVNKYKPLNPRSKRMKFYEALEHLIGLNKTAGKPQEASGILEHFIRLDDKNPDLWIKLGDIFAGTDAERAMQCYQKAGLLDPEYLTIYYKKAELLEKQNGKEALTEAIGYYMKALKISPSAFANFKIGTIFVRLNHPDIAVLYFENAIYEDPSYIPARLELIRTLEAQNRLQQALEKVVEAVETVQSKRLYEIGGDLYARLEQTEKAADFYTKSYELGNRGLEFLLKYSEIHKTSDPRKFRHLLLEADYLYPDNPEIKKRMLNGKNR